MTESRSSGRGFTGWSRRRETSARVRVVDSLARWVISVGGVGALLAVAVVGVFLVIETLPLFRAAHVELESRAPLTGADPSPVLQARVDEYGLLVWQVRADGEVEVRRLDDAALLDRRRPFGEATPRSAAFSRSEGTAVFGFDDGTLRTVRLRFEVEFLSDEAPPPELADLEPGGRRTYAGGVVVRTTEGQLRLERVAVETEPPLQVTRGVPLLRVDRSLRTTGPVVATLDAEGVLRVSSIRRTKNLLTGEEKLTLRGGKLELPEAREHPPRWLALTGLGDNAILVWEDGRFVRVDARRPRSLRVAERGDLLPDPRRRVTALDFLVGKTSIVVGDDRGGVGVWFRVKPEGYETVDGALLVRGHDLGEEGRPVRAFGPSGRSRLLATLHDDGRVRLFYVTNEREIATATVPDGARGALVLSPKDDRVVALGDEALAVLSLDAPHPEVSFATLFRPIWYEGYEKPEHVWQSSSGSDAFEPKYGLWPLVFGTLKATLYSMLFGLPLALLAAIYTSEFLSPRTRARVKPAIEVMASLPSVVLGFLGALVFAPIVERHVVAVVLSLAAVPFSVLLAAHLWQLLPAALTRRFQRLRLVAVGLALPLGVGLARVLAPAVEAGLFGGDFRAWLDGQVGDGRGAWMFVLLPGSALAATLYSARVVSPRMRATFGRLGRTPFAALELLRFLVLAAAAVVLALAVSSLFTAAGLDPRGTFVSTYVQRNALVVGFVMGFAVVPIIYTIAEDALSSVPEHLRAASLGAGATPWQTAMRVVVPTAMSGLFSAAMIGLGRAVGETMIVLMAAGNTPVLDWNVFNGFRTLSANIAVEIPEAVRGSTHYRLLFLAALTLFAMTFVVNTVAEVVRLRFRKRAFQL